MAIAASSVTPTNSLEDFRLEFNNLVTDVTGITSTNTFSTAIVFEGATADGYETTLTVVDPTADRTWTLPNVTDTVVGKATTDTLTNKTLTTPVITEIDSGSTITLDATTSITLDAAAGDINLTPAATYDINVPTNIGITFGDDGEKIEGDGTDLTISGNNINLTATADVVIPADVGITFGSGEKIEGDSTDLTVTSGADINLTATSDVNIPSGVGVTFGNDGEKIEGDGTDLTVASSGALTLTSTSHTVDTSGDIVLDADGGDIFFKDAGTTFGSATNTSGDLIIKSGTTTALTFDGANATFAGTVTIGSAEISEAELEILDGANVTTTELNLIDGGTSRGTIAVATGDGILINDGGTMRMTNVDTVSTYFASHAVGGGNVVTTGALDSGSITSGFGTIDTGASAITTTGVITGGTVEATTDTAASDNAAMGYTAGEGLILTGQGSTNDVTIKNDADGAVISIPTGTTNVTIAGDLTISGDDLFMGTNTSGAALIADGTNYNPVVISGDATIATNGALTIASTSVEGSMLNTNVISGQTALTSAVATTDELMISDAGTLKRVDVSLITDLATGDATALAIALG